MKVVILAGGKGLRYNSDIPKALAMIGDKPIIYHIMDVYAIQGYNDFIIATGYKKELIEEYISNMKQIEPDYNIQCIDTGQESNTGKRIKLIEEYIPKEDKHFFCTYADGIGNINLNKLLIQHIDNNIMATITVVKPYSQFGIIKFNKFSKVIEFEEKPKMNEHINGGFFIFNKEIFDCIDLCKNEELEKEIFSKLIKKNELGVYKHNGFWETLNTTKDEIRLNVLYKKSIDSKTELEWYSI